MLSLKLIKGADIAEGVRQEAQVSDQQIRFVVGRDPSCDWQIPDRTLAVSGRHCEILFATAEPILRDLSTNGTFVNGSAQRLTGDHVLRDGDQIALGPYMFSVGVTAPRTDTPTQAPATAQRPDDKTTFVPHAATLDPTSIRQVVAASTPMTAMPPTSPLLPSRAAARGADPAAMLLTPSTPGAPRVAAPPTAEAEPPSNLTIIRPAPKPPVRSGAIPAVAATSANAAATGSAADAAPKPMPTPSIAPMPGPVNVVSQWLSTSADDASHLGSLASGNADSDEFRRRLAAGLGVPLAALAGRDPAELAEQLGALTRVAVGSVRLLVEQQARARRQLRSRQQTIFRVRESNPLRFAPTVEDALLSLLAAPSDAQTMLQQACSDLSAHHERLLNSFRGAAQRLGEELDPKSLERAVPGEAPIGSAAQAARKARLWDLYSVLWQSLGQSAGQPWSEGFVEAALLQITAAYDDTPQS
jgi:type VI secretion system protein ImpI